MSSSSSAVQSQLNSQSVSAINPDYYIDQNRGKQNLYEVDHVILNGGTLVLERDKLHRRKLFTTVAASTTIQLPSPELCVGTEFEVIIKSQGISNTISFTSTANASVSGSSAVNLVGSIIGTVDIDLILSTVVSDTAGIPYATLSLLEVQSHLSFIKFHSVGPYWVIDGVTGCLVSWL
jgi:hypothetical protein